GLLADRTPFSLRLAQTGGGGSYIDTDALFSVVLVPEPTCQLGCLMAAFVLFARVRSGRNSR
ncbi:MAG: hypothetical protein KDA60_03520, partial [Planctomycetales bacterium]|nr:hypothetical protein [Planctomycetales bacterium]